jgi:segregation and condensation protein A
MEIEIDVYSGSFEVLVELVREKKVPIKKISLSTIADIFNDYVENNFNFIEAGEYLSLASYLTYLKSKEILPTSKDDECFKRQRNMIYSLIEDYDLIKDTSEIIKRELGKPAKKFVNVRNTKQFDENKMEIQLDSFFSEYIEMYGKLEILKEIYTVEKAMESLKSYQELYVMDLYEISGKNKLKFIVLFLAALSLVVGELFNYENGKFINLKKEIVNREYEDEEEEINTI